MNILICFSIIFILILIHTLWPRYVYDPQYEVLDVFDVLKENPDIRLETGDILFAKNCTKCKYNDNIINNGFQFLFKNTFNSFRWYFMNMVNYTHVAIILRLNINGVEKPYICHIDGGDPMYDVIRKKYISKESAVVCDMDHLNERGGVMHIYKYKGPKIEKDMMYWILKNRNIKYPSSTYNLAMVNALKWCKNPEGVMACTDFVENTLCELNIIDKEIVSGQSTVKDIINIVKYNDHYSNTPIVLKNKCFEEKHFS